MGSSEGQHTPATSTTSTAAVDDDSPDDVGEHARAADDVDEDPGSVGDMASRSDLARWTGVVPDDATPDDRDRPRRARALDRPSLGEWTDSSDTGGEMAAARTLPLAGTRTDPGTDSDTGVADSPSVDFEYIEAPAARWTFDPDSVRLYVESQLRGRVLNLFAGQTHLRHDDEVVRNDLDETVVADHHFNALEVAEHFSPRSFDTVVLDPPYNVRKAREKYNGKFRGKFTVIKERLVPLVKLGGRVIHFGYASTGMSRSRGFEKSGIALINHKGDHNDTICVVEERVEGGLDAFADIGTEPISTAVPNERDDTPLVDGDAVTDGGDPE